MMKFEDFIRKVTSRKFILSFAAFVGSIGMSIAGVKFENETIAIIGMVCSMLSSALYAAAEAYVDGKREEKKPDGE